MNASRKNSEFEICSSCFNWKYSIEPVPTIATPTAVLNNVFTCGNLIVIGKIQCIPVKRMQFNCFTQIKIGSILKCFSFLKWNVFINNCFNCSNLTKISSYVCSFLMSYDSVFFFFDFSDSKNITSIISYYSHSSQTSHSWSKEKKKAEILVNFRLKNRF